MNLFIVHELNADLILKDFFFLGGGGGGGWGGGGWDCLTKNADPDNKFLF